MNVVASPMIYNMQEGGESTSDGEDMLCRLPLVFSCNIVSVFNAISTHII